MLTRVGARRSRSRGDWRERFVGDQQGLQTGRLLGFQGPCQGAPQSRGGQVTDLGDQAGQHRDSRQQYLAFDQPGRGQVEEDAGAFGTDPGPVGDPAGQGGGLGALVEVAVAIATADLGGVIPAFLASCVASQAIGVVDAQLPGEVGHDSRGDFGQVGQEGAQKPHGPDLRGEPETVVIAPAPGDEATILVVEVEVAFELGGRWLARVAAIASLLILGQEVDRHPRPFLKSPIRLGCRVPNRVTMPEASADPGNHRLPASRNPVTKWVYPSWRSTQPTSPIVERSPRCPSVARGAGLGSPGVSPASGWRSETQDHADDQAKRHAYRHAQPSAKR